MDYVRFTALPVTYMHKGKFTWEPSVLDLNPKACNQTKLSFCTVQEFTLFPSTSSDILPQWSPTHTVSSVMQSLFPVCYKKNQVQIAHSDYITSKFCVPQFTAKADKEAIIKYWKKIPFPQAELRNWKACTIPQPAMLKLLRSPPFPFPWYFQHRHSLK